MAAAFAAVDLEGARAVEEAATVVLALVVDVTADRAKAGSETPGGNAVANGAIVHATTTTTIERLGLRRCQRWALS